MKNIKDYILISSFTFMIIVVFLIINIFIVKRPYVSLTTSDDIIQKQNNLKAEISKVKDEKCRISLNDLLDESIRITFNGDIRLSNFYDLISTNKIMKHYEDIKNDCNLTTEELNKYDIANKYLTKMSLYDSLISNYLYQYELNFNDEASYYYESGISQIAYITLKSSEVELIQDYLKIIGEK